MTGNDNFEKKIKGKLEDVNTPYEESAWLNFAPLLDAPSIPLWKRWYMPYLYSTLLFILASIWFFQKNGSTSSNLDGIDIKNSVYLADTLYRRDTIWIIDTVYVIKKVVIEELEKTQKVNQDSKIKESLFTLSVPSRNDGLKSEKQDSKTIINDQGNVRKKEASENTVTSVSQAKTSHTADSLKTKPVIQENQAKGSINNSKPSRNTIMAPSIGPEETFVMKLDKELVEGDTSNWNHTPTKNINKPYFNLEAGLSLLIPVNRQIEYYPSFTQYLNMGIEWENGIGLYTGIMRSQNKGEIDDDDLSSFSTSVLDALPGIPVDILDIDEIYLTNKQWYFPVELRWRSLYYSGFSFESGLGLVGNYLVRQDFQYEFEDRLGLSDQFESAAIRQFRISHLKIGLGTNYLLSGRWGMFLRSHYWLPISDVGVLKNRTHGLEVGLGINYFLGR